jgi:outer membrane receptor protein involved in Fe transport
MMLLLLLLIGLVPAISAKAADTGQLSGKVVDAKTGELLLGVTVMLEGTTKGSTTNIDGTFLIKNVPVGIYNLVVSSVGYITKKYDSLEVKKGVQNIDLSLEQQTVDLNKKIVVTAKMAESSDAAVLRNRQKAVTVSDAIGAQAISRAGGGNTAQALIRVTGASTDGKFVFIRGLGDRYSNTQMNGTVLPTPDPDKQAVPLDLVPSDLLENVVVTKSFMADMPGNFSGGSINLITKDFPEKRTISFATGTSYNSIVTNSTVLGTSASSTDWRASDDGMRQLPEFLQNPDNIDDLPKGNTIIRDSTVAETIKNASQSFRNDYSPKKRTAPLNQSYAINVGDNFQLFGNSLGIVGSLAYSRQQKYYENGEVRLSYAANDSLLETYYEFTDSRGVDEVLWGGLASASYRLGTNHILGMNYIYNRNAESEARYLVGHEYYNDPYSWLESRVVSYTERNLGSLQFKGEHRFSLLLPLHLEWRFGSSTTRQEQPDLREFENNYFVDSSNYPEIDTLYGIGSGYRWPARFWRSLEESNNEYNFNLAAKLSRNVRMKVGMSYLKKERENRQIQFNMTGDPNLLNNFNGDVDRFADTAGYYTRYGSNPSNYSYVFPVYYINGTQMRDQYDGTQKITAEYLMLEMPLIGRLNFVGGIRHENTDMAVTSFDPSRRGGKIDGSDWLPSLSLIYELNDRMNLRAAYGRTLARPNLREIAPYGAEEFAGSRLFVGNDSLTYTKIRNYDVRWEWFMRPGEIVAISAFYKKFKDPIELTFFSSNYDIWPVNAPEAKNYGLELEFRKRLDVVADFLRNFNLGGNMTLVNSKLKIPEKEWQEMLSVDRNAPRHRPMANQSPYIINANIGFSSFRSGTTADIFYNVFGRRFYYNAQGGAPDIYEMPRHSLDMTFSQAIWRGVSLKLSGKNLLNAHFEADYYYLGTGEKVVYRKYDIGRTFGVSLNYRVL